MKPKPLQWPLDGLAHKSIIEWWYFNGQVRDAAGNRYSFMDCLFKADLKRIKLPFLKIPFKEFYPSPYIYSAHCLVTDLGKQISHKEIQGLSLISGDSFSRPLLFVNYFDPLAGSYLNCEIAEESPFKFHLKNSRLDLHLSSRRPPLLEGGLGFIELCGRRSRYYSLTDLAVSGKIKIKNKWLEVKGDSWMDHQWADEFYSKDKWTWLCLKLDNGWDIMCVEYDNGKNKDYQVDLIGKKGQEHYKNLKLFPGKKVWASRATKAQYPLSWDLEIPDKQLKLKAKAMIKDQEMIFGTINYWEGPIEVTGSQGGKKVKGWGFMELVNYPSDYNFLVLAGKEINAKIGRAVSTKIKKMFS